MRLLGFGLFMSFLMILSGMEYIIRWEMYVHPFIKIIGSGVITIYLLFAFFAGLCLMISGDIYDGKK
uniref:Uncharacterized protein n=1 Tax=viral metagenome TaxID=1070528 RepID=A0A6M3ITK8_9ZZZZ